MIYPRNNTRIYIFLYLLLLFAHVYLIWSLDYFPTQDGPSHVYNLAILHDLMNEGNTWGAYYEENLRPVPNLGFQIFSYPFLAWFNALQTERIFLTLYICALTLSIPLYLKAFDCSPFPASFIVFPLSFNFPLLMGFYSYCIGIPLFIIFFTLAWIFRNINFYYTFFLHIFCGLVLFFVHIIPFVFYILSLLTISLHYLFKYKSFLFIIIYKAPSQLTLLFILYYYLSLNNNDSFFDMSYILSLERFIYLIIDLLTFSTFDFSFYALITSFLFIYIILITLYSYKNFTYHTNSSSMYFICKPFFLVPAILLFLYFIFPFNFGGGAYFNQRIPWVILLLILPLIVELNVFKSTYVISIFIFLIISVSLLRFVDIHSKSMTVTKYTSGLHIHIPENSIIMGINQHHMDNSRLNILMHASSYYALKHQAIDIGNYEAYFDYFPIQFNKNLPPVPRLSRIENDPDKIALNKYPEISYIILWKNKSRSLDHVNDNYDLLFKNDNISIWERL